MSKEKDEGKDLTTAKSSVYADAKVLYLEPKKLKDNELNSRTESLNIDNEPFSTFIRVPLLITPEKVLLRGHRRKRIALRDGIEKVPCIVLNEKLSTEEQLDLLNDHSSEMPLTKFEAYGTCCKYLAIGINKNAVIRRCSNVLCKAFGAPKSKKEEDLLGKFRGTVQHFERMLKLPAVIREEAEKEYRSDIEGKGALTHKDVTALFKNFDKARLADIVNVSAEHPDAGTMESFHALLELKDSKPEKTDAPKRSLSYKELEKNLVFIKNEVARQALLYAMGEITLEELQKSL